MYTPAGPSRSTPNSARLSPSESVHRATPTSECSHSSFESPGGACTDRPGSTASQVAEHLSPFDPYYRQHQGPGVNTGAHLLNPAQISRHVPSYPISGESAYTWQGDGAGGGYRSLYSSQTRPGWSGGSFADQATDSLHASMAQVMAEVKGLVARVTSLSEKEAERSKITNEILTRIERVEAQMNELDGAAREGIGMGAKRPSGGPKTSSNEHPLLKVCYYIVSSVPSALKTSARGAYEIFSDVWSGGVREQRETH